MLTAHRSSGPWFQQTEPPAALKEAAHNRLATATSAILWRRPAGKALGEEGMVGDLAGKCLLLPAAGERCRPSTRGFRIRFSLKCYGAFHRGLSSGRTTQGYAVPVLAANSAAGDSVELTVASALVREIAVSDTYHGLLKLVGREPA